MYVAINIWGPIQYQRHACEATDTTEALWEGTTFPKWQLEAKGIRMLGASMCLSSLDQPHLRLPPTLIGPRALFKPSFRSSFPAWAILEGCWSPVQSQLCSAWPGSHLIWTSTYGLTWPWPCLTTVMLLYDLDSWLRLATMSGSVLLGYCGIGPDWQGPCPAGPGLHSALGSPSLREQSRSCCFLTRTDTLVYLAAEFCARELTWVLWMLSAITLACFNDRRQTT